MARRKPVVSYLRASSDLDVKAQSEANRRFAEANRYRVVEEMVENGPMRRLRDNGSNIASDQLMLPSSWASLPISSWAYWFSCQYARALSCSIRSGDGRLRKGMAPTIAEARQWQYVSRMMPAGSAWSS